MLHIDASSAVDIKCTVRKSEDVIQGKLKVMTFGEQFKSLPLL